MQEAICHTLQSRASLKTAAPKHDAGQGTDDSAVSLLEENLASGPSLDIRVHCNCGETQGKSPIDEPSSWELSKCEYVFASPIMWVSPPCHMRASSTDGFAFVYFTVHYLLSQSRSENYTWNSFTKGCRERAGHIQLSVNSVCAGMWCECVYVSVRCVQPRITQLHTKHLLSAQHPGDHILQVC